MGEIQVFKVGMDGTDVVDVSVELQFVLKGHKYGVQQIRAYEDVVVSIGDENDKGMIVWETKTPRILSANLIKKSKINGVAFIGKAEKDTCIKFVTFGNNNHLKVWKVNVEKDEVMVQYNVEGVS